jgi:hypothetical protein
VSGANRLGDFEDESYLACIASQFGFVEDMPDLMQASDAGL